MSAPFTARPPTANDLDGIGATRRRLMGAASAAAALFATGRTIAEAANAPAAGEVIARSSGSPSALPQEQGDDPLEKQAFDTISAANYTEDGAPFQPLLIKFAAPGAFKNIWNSARADTHITFYRFLGAKDGFLPLGDMPLVATSTTGAMPGKLPVMVVKAMPGQEGALAHPTGFQYLLWDSGSGNYRNVYYWWPIAPAGYKALGIVVTDGSDPNKDSTAANYWCVRDDLLQQVGTQLLWGDSGTHIKSDSSLQHAVLDKNGSAPAGRILIAPTTMLSNLVPDGPNNNSFALNVGKCLLGQQVTLPEPGYVKGAAQDVVQSEMLGQIAVMPCTGITDAGLVGDKPVVSPFYYITSEPHWRCATTESTTAGGTKTVTLYVGTEQSQSTTVQETTSLTVEGSVGVESKGSASVSVSYTTEMSVATTTGTTTKNDTTNQFEFSVPPAPVTQFWQRVVSLRVYRTPPPHDEYGGMNWGGIAHADFFTDDRRFTQGS